jgi:hypothetical protein
MFISAIAGARGISGAGNWENSANCDTSMKLSGNHL